MEARVLSAGKRFILRQIKYYPNVTHGTTKVVAGPRVKIQVSQYPEIVKRPHEIKKNRTIENQDRRMALERLYPSIGKEEGLGIF